MSWLALDIGGANLKVADGLGFAASRPFALWQAPELLASELAELIGAAPPASSIAVTMTGELADCYPSRTAGVQHILDAAAHACGKRNLRVYLTDGRLVDLAAARRRPLDAAASNWHALASFANRFVAAWPALLIDLGSTTTDIISLAQSGPSPAATSDTERLLSRELVYTGVRRTPINVVIDELPWRGQRCPVASELFATTADAYIILRELAEDPADLNTADGRPRTRDASHARMARIICADAESFAMADAAAAAQEVKFAQLDLLESAIGQVARRLPQPPQSLLLSGEGEFVLHELTARLPWKCRVLSLAQELGPLVSLCAPAHALAVLAREGLASD